MSSWKEQALEARTRLWVNANVATRLVCEQLDGKMMYWVSECTCWLPGLTGSSVAHEGSRLQANRRRESRDSEVSGSALDLYDSSRTRTSSVDDGARALII